MHAYNEECLKLLAKYFVNIDTIISKKLLRRAPSYEITLTDELLANLDEESIIRENPSFLIWLRAEIERLNNTYIDEIHSKSPDLDLKIETYDHSRGFEYTLSNVDIGLHIEFGRPDQINYRNEIYLLQAKRLRPEIIEGNPTYSARSAFSSFGRHQHEAMRSFEHRLDLDVFRYM